MVNPVPGYSISTVYRKSGSWSCGYHTGVDFAAPKGTPIVAAIDGQIRHRNYGSSLGYHQFAISPDPGQPFASGEVFYAHTYDRPADGIYVKAGDVVAHVGVEGNTTGPHLHFEYHPNSKNNWGCEPICANPQPVIDHGGGSTPPPSSGAPYVTKDVYSNKMGYGEPTNGDDSSDSVKELQERLNRISLVGGATLPVTGFYGKMTDAEVRKWQEQVCHDPPDPAGKSYLGPKQFARMFPSPPYTRHDAGLPAVASGGGGTPPPDPGGGGNGGDVNLPPPPGLLVPWATWDPITNFPGLRPFVGTAKKITLHTTETNVKPNWEQQQKGIPHFTLDPMTGQLWQHLALDIAAYTMNGGDHSPNSDAGVNIQIEMIGYTADCYRWSDGSYDTIRLLLDWISTNCGVPYDFPVPFDSPPRLGWDNEYETVSGILGHCHAPYNDHHDPTGLDVDRLIDVETPPIPPPEGDYVTREEWLAYREELADEIQDVVDTVDPDS